MKQYVVDTFTDRVFRGNPAAVCITDQWLSDELMQAIARENGFSETAFAVPENGDYRLRWFTPGGEIDLCGHATLAASYIILNCIQKEKQAVEFITSSGKLAVTRRDDLYEMDFPAYELHPVTVTETMAEAFGARPLEAYMGRDLLCVFADEEIVRQLTPDQEKLKELDGLLQHVTARGQDYDCVSRTFAPKLAVKEDPVCGSGHCHILPYWAKQIQKTQLIAFQASARGGILYGKVSGNRISLAGKAVLFSEAEIYVGEK